ncbi:PEP-CTERM sorting domain-containing protein [Pseudomonadales bacterium]|nr:PEP-CTERM sorting domain-containing protein [Pseudomonadales bacterium]
MKTKILKMGLGAIAGLSLSGMAQAAIINFNLENIGVDGSITNSVTSSGVTVNIAPASGNMHACSYFDSSQFCFAGQGTNTPLNPANVSGTRFISTYAGSHTTFIHNAAPIAFSFSETIKSFGLTTLDLLEAGGNGAITFTLSGDGGSSTHSISGPQGASGVDLDFAISSAAFDITTVSFAVAGGAVYGAAYGIDDIFVEVADVPAPPGLALLVLGLAGLGFSRKRKSG